MYAGGRGRILRCAGLPPLSVLGAVLGGGGPRRGALHPGPAAARGDGRQRRRAPRRSGPPSTAQPALGWSARPSRPPTSVISCARGAPWTSPARRSSTPWPTITIRCPDQATMGLLHAGLDAQAGGRAWSSDVIGGEPGHQRRRPTTSRAVVTCGYADQMAESMSAKRAAVAVANFLAAQRYTRDEVFADPDPVPAAAGALRVVVPGGARRYRRLGLRAAGGLDAAVRRDQPGPAARPTASRAIPQDLRKRIRLPLRCEQRRRRRVHAAQVARGAARRTARLRAAPRSDRASGRPSPAARPC